MITGVHCINNHCVEDMVMNICLRNLLPYPLMFADSWDFSYSRTNNICEFGGHEYGKKFPHKETIENYLGLKLSEMKDISDIFSKHLKSENIAIFCDSYYCGWTESSGIHHQPHCFWGEKRTEDSLEISDPYLGIYNKEISYQNLIQGNAYAVVFVKQNINRLSYISILQESLRKVEKALDSFEQYCIDFHDSEINIMLMEQIIFHPLYQNITYLANSRYNYSIFLNYLSEKMQDNGLHNLAVEFYKIGFEWNKVKDLCMKLLLRYSEQKKKKMGDLLSQILEKEKKTYVRFTNDFIKI